MKVARDIMQKTVVSVGVDAPLTTIYQVFCDEEISGAPVVTDDGTVVGVLSVTDLVRSTRDAQEARPELSLFYHGSQAELHPEWLLSEEEFEDRLASHVAADVMTPEVVSVTPDTPVSDVVKKILEYRIHRVLVLEPRGESLSLVGIITVFDLVNLLL